MKENVQVEVSGLVVLREEWCEMANELIREM